jgi:ATP-binding cassette subfamily F protein 3
MESCDSLMSAIDRFDGAVLIATHNEMFLHTLTSRLVVFDGPRPFLFEGSYQDFLDRRGWEDEGTLNGSTSQERKGKPVQRERRVKRAEIIRERSQALKQIKHRISALEEEIEKAEGHLAENNKALIDASAGAAGEHIQRLSMENHRLKIRVEKLYALLEDQLHESEETAAKFDKLLQKL